MLWHVLFVSLLKYKKLLLFIQPILLLPTSSLEDNQILLIFAFMLTVFVFLLFPFGLFSLSLPLLIYMHLPIRPDIVFNPKLRLKTQVKRQPVLLHFLKLWKIVTALLINYKLAILFGLKKLDINLRHFFSLNLKSPFAINI